MVNKIKRDRRQLIILINARTFENENEIWDLIKDSHHFRYLDLFNFNDGKIITNQYLHDDLEDLRAEGIIERDNPYKLTERGRRLVKDAQDFENAIVKDILITKHRDEY